MMGNFSKKWTVGFSLFLHASHLHQWSDTAIACCFTCQWCIPPKRILSNAHSNSTNSRATFLTSKKDLVSIQNSLRKFQLIYGSEVGGGGNEVTCNCHSICQKQLGDQCYLLKTGWVPVTCCWATNISLLEATEIQALRSTLYNHPPCKAIPRACCFAQSEVAVERKMVASISVSNPTALPRKVNTVTTPNHGWKKRKSMSPSRRRNSVGALLVFKYLLMPIMFTIFLPRKGTTDLTAG